MSTCIKSAHIDLTSGFIVEFTRRSREVKTLFVSRRHSTVESLRPKIWRR